MSANIENYDIYCRTCARTFPRQPLVPLFASANPAINAIQRYQNNKFKISTDDGLPQQICSECLNNFNIMNEFLEVCEQSQENLQNFITINSVKHDIKIENENFDYEDEEFLLDELGDEVEIGDEIKIELICSPTLELENKTVEVAEKNYENILSNNLSDVEYNSNITVKKENIKRQPRTWIKSLQNNVVETVKTEKISNISNSDSEEYFNDDFKEDFTLKCDFCSKKFQTYIKLQEHEENHHNKSQKKIFKIMCEMCGTVVEEAFMKDHMDQHIGKTTEYNCEICCRRFFQYKTYKHHVETKHLITTKFHCDICDRGFKMEYNLKNHVKLEHSAGTQTKVKSTQNSSRPKANLKCYYCSKKFYNTVTLVRHCTTHNKPDAKDAKHICNYCGTVFKRADHLKIHINSQHLKSQEFKCSYCDKIYYASFVLNRHIKNSHSGLKNTRVTCEFCNKSLATKEYLNRHKMEFHSKEKTLNCPICEEKFFRRVELKAHSKVHDVIINNFEQKDMIIKEFCSEIVEGDRKMKIENPENFNDSIPGNCNDSIPENCNDSITDNCIEMNDEQVQMIMEYVEDDEEEL